MNNNKYCFLIITLFAFTAVFSISNKSFAQIGTVTTCADVRVNSGNGISGGFAGFTGGAGGAFATTGGQVFPFNPSDFNTSSECAGASIVGNTDIPWPAFDIVPNTDLTEEEQEEERLSWFGLTTRDANRGRAGKNAPLFMNAHGICRKIDNTTAVSSMEPEFVDVINYEAWETVHGVSVGGNPNGGFTRVANRSDLPAITVCCSPISVNICGSLVTTEYAQVGDVVEVYTGGGYAQLSCASNNTFVTINTIGICNGGGGGGSDPGYHNPNTGGTISQNDFESLSPSAQSNLTEQGYGPTSNVDTNATGAAAAAAAAETAEAQAEAEAQAALAAAEAARVAAEAAAAAAQAAEDAANDDDDDDPPP